jgi:hypothetical protein
MPLVRVCLVNMPLMLVDIVKDALSSHPGIVLAYAVSPLQAHSDAPAQMPNPARESPDR